MRRLPVVVFAVSVGLLLTGSEAFSQQNPSSNRSTDTSTSTSTSTSTPYNWNGFYGGGNLGGSFGGSDFLSALGSGVPFFEGQPYPNAPTQNPSTPGIIAAYQSNHANGSSFSGGLNAGYNYLTGGILLGLEADVDFLRLNQSKTTSAFGDPLNGSPFYTFRSSIQANYIASLRPRVGFQVAGALVYLTGGVALTTLKYQHDFRGVGGGFPANGFPDGIFESASASRTLAGWTVGGGTELPIYSNVSLRAEYLFTEFGNLSTNDNKIFPLAPFPFPDVACGALVNLGDNRPFPVPNPTPRQCFDHKANLNLHRIRLGINFKF
jgi:outer membrane immunogenic protein